MNTPTTSPLQCVAPAEAGLQPDRLERIGMAMRAEVAAGRIPGAVVGILRGGRLAYLEAFGVRDPAGSAPLQTDAVFSIASMTKVAVSVATLMLYEEGRVLLGDHVSKFLPELADMKVARVQADGTMVPTPAERAITIQDLLRHTSGLTYRDRGQTPAHKLYPGSSMYAAVKYSSAQFLERIAASPLLFEPGSNWEYGFSTDILGLVVERITGVTLDVALDRMIFAPLGMSHTGFKLRDDQQSRYARAYPKDAVSGAPQSILHATGDAMQWQSGGGGAVSTASDYLRFADMLRCGGTRDNVRLLGPRTIRLMTADHLPASASARIADSMDPAAAGYGFGLGVAVRRQDGIAAMSGSAGDYYWSGAYGTYFWVDPREDLTVVFMAAAPGLIRLRYRQLTRALVYQAIVA